MYVATRELSETMPGGVRVLHAAGSVLERFTTWDYAVQRALQRMGYVREQADVEPAAPAAEADAKADVHTGAITCPVCPDRIFVNHQGLKLHMTRIHGGKTA